MSAIPNHHSHHKVDALLGWFNAIAGRLQRTVSGRLLRIMGALASECCCEEEEPPPAECPTDCTACAATLTVVVSGLTGDCSCMNGTYSVPKTGTECIWQVGVVQDQVNNECGVILTVDCVVGWRVTIDGISLPPFFDSAIFRGVGVAQACPVGLTITAPRLSGGCSGQTATAVIS